MKSDLSGFYELSVEQRLKKIKELCGLTDDEAHILYNTGCLSLRTSDRMIENVIGTVELPVGVATNFRINGHDVLIPMAIEEPSVVAAASHAAKLCRPAGFTASSDEPLMIGQIQLMNAHNAKERILAAREQITEMANSRDSTLVKIGGGLKDIEVRELQSPRGRITVVHLIVNVQDAMGANAVNTMCESVAPFLEELTGGRSVLKIISNLAVYRLARAKAVWTKDDLGEETIEGILDAYAFAQADPYRCATHNKGIMNGVDAVMIATGNDFRAAEAGAHAYAAKDHSYKPLTHYEKDAHGNLVGTIELPIAAGIVGGATRTNPVASIALKILNVKRSGNLAEAAACVGLANNFAAMRAMVKEGIQAGHMKLHASNIAVAAGATHEEVPKITRQMIREKKITMAYAAELLAELRG